MLRYYFRHRPGANFEVIDTGPEGDGTVVHRPMAQDVQEEDAFTITLALNRMEHPGFLSIGSQHRDGHENWTRWAMFEADKFTNTEAIELLSWYAYGSGTGREFGHPAECVRRKNLLIVKQFCGLDV